MYSKRITVQKAQYHEDGTVTKEKNSEERHIMKEKEIVELRAHHLLCMPMYSGHGYSEGFCEHMSEVIDYLHTGKPKLRIMPSPDEVCSHCPNLQPVSDAKVDLEGNDLNWELVRSEDPRVAGRSCKHEARTSAKDSMLLDAFGLTGGVEYTIEELIATVQKNMTEAVFEKSCGKCSWREQGLCNYEMWQDHFPKLFSR